MKKTDWGFWLIFIAAGIFLLVIGLPRADAQTVKAPEKEPDEVIILPPEETPEPAYDVPLDAELQEYICTIADMHELSAPLVLAVIGTESNYDAGKIGDEGNAIGLMQVQPRWHRERMRTLGVSDLTDPRGNVLVGVSILADEIHKGGVEWGLTAYNAGEAHANFMAKTGQLSEYAETVMRLEQIIAGV